MIERPFGQGRVILFASTASPRWNNLPDHAGIFVPLMNRTMGWILLEQNRQLNVKVGDKFIFHPAARSPRPGSNHHPPRHRRWRHARLPPGRDGAMAKPPSLVYDDTGLAGEYDVVIGSAKPVKFAAQADKNESSLDDIGEAQKKQLSQSAVVLDWKQGSRSKDNARQGTRRNRIGGCRSPRSC